MGKRKKISLIGDDLYQNVVNRHRSTLQRKDGKKKLQSDHGGYPVSNEEYEKIKAFWKPYGIAPKKYWFCLFSNGEGGFSEKYIPGDTWVSKILPYYNDLMWGRAFADKCFYDRLFPNLNRPRTIVKNSCGRFYDGSENIITRDEAMALCLKEKQFIAKFATFSYGGKNIYVLKDGEVTQEAVKAFFDEFKINFVVQELVEQHEELAKLNRSSLNTLRVISFFFRGEVHILSSQLRVGGEGARVDNYSSNGYACNVNPDGRLNERAVSKSGWVTKHPNGFEFKDIVVPSYDKVLRIIKEEAPKLPRLGLIGWDFGIGRDGEPVFIELNVFPGQNQRGSGPTFGDLTEAVLRDVFIEKNLTDAFN